MPQAGPATPSGRAETEHFGDSFATQYFLTSVSILKQSTPPKIPKKEDATLPAFSRLRGQYEGCPPGVRLEMGFGCLLDHVWGPGRPWPGIL